MSYITQNEIDNLPHPPAEWLEEMQNERDEMNYYYNEFINEMDYETKLDLIKEHLNINLPHKRQHRIIRDIIDNYLNNYQSYNDIYSKGNHLEFYADWDTVPDFTNRIGLKTKKELRTFIKNDMIEKYSNNGEKEIKLFKTFDWQERFAMCKLDYELNTQEDIDMWYMIKDGLKNNINIGFILSLTMRQK